MCIRSALGAVPIVAAGALLPYAAAAANPPNPPRALAFMAQGSSPNMLGTTALPIRASRFAESWSRAREDASASPILQRLVAPARRLSPLQQIAYVQRAVGSRIRFLSDTTQWGQHDYWASASETLARGAGDMEDRAIVKMQALQALGFRPTDLFLTLARDRVGGPIAVLTARINGRYFVLDDNSGAPFPIERRAFEFQPLMSFGWAGTWVHTRPAAARAGASK
ncbi:MAG: transglutaminase-like cysteine peptidase [Sphingomicrobium sp.]